MRIVRDYLSISETDRGAVVAIGNFDGVHLGHQMVIEQARRKAREHGAPLGIVTFEPHPRIFFRPADRSFQLMNVRAKVRRFDELRVEVLYMLRFDRTLAECTEDRFVREILAGKLGIKGAVVGQDFRFGKGREGTADSLAQLGKRCAIDVSIAPILEKTEVNTLHPRFGWRWLQVISQRQQRFSVAGIGLRALSGKERKEDGN